MRNLLLLLACLLTAISPLHAQNRTVTGTVTDAAGAPLANVSVLVKNTNVGTTSNGQGQFTLSVPSGARTLVFSFVGLATREVQLGSSNNVSVSLSTEDASLSEVVVVGYSSTTKEAFTGSAKQVSAERIENKNVSNVSQALAGEVAGVRVINTSGQPGTSATIRIRGIGSVNGNRSPLYVVDGVPYSGSINAINPADIASITVLKDAAATSIYGSRGANGVIVITTATGRGRESFIEADVKYGTNRALLPRYDVLKSPEEYIGLSWEALYNEGVASGSTNPVNFANTNLFSGNGIDPSNNIWNVPGADLIDPITRTVKPNVKRLFDPEDWEEYAFQPSSRVEANVRMGGGQGRTNFFTSLGYLKDEGYIVNSDFRRFSGRINLNHEVKTWLTSSFNLNYANTITNNNGQEANSNSIFWFVDNIPSIYPLFLRDAQGSFVTDPVFGGNQFDYGASGRKFGSLTNAIADATYNTNRTLRDELTGNGSLTIKFIEGLTLENRLGVQFYNSKNIQRENKFYGSSASQGGSIYHNRTELMNTNLLNMLRYNKQFRAHSLEVLAAHESTDYKQSITQVYATNLVENESLELNNAVVSSRPTSYANTNRLESYFAQANYDFNNTYYLSATLRRDGSSRFRNEKWGNFGSIGAAWEISKMDFMRKIPIVNYLKLKASYGILGDQSGVGLYSGYDRFDIENLNDNPSFPPGPKGNPDLTWESSKMFQTGIDFRLGTFLDGSVEYYNKKTNNLIFERRVGPSLGFALITVNDGVLRNQGIEFELVGHILKNKNFFLDLGVNGEHFTNKILEMPIDPSTGKQKAIDVQAPYGWGVGHSVFDYYIRNFAGVDPTDGRSMWTVYYDDLNNDGVYTSNEGVLNLEDFYDKNPAKRGALKEGTTKTFSRATQYYIGKSSIPTLRGGINLTGGWKGFDLAVQFLYSIGGYSYDYAYAGLMGNDLIGNNNWHTDIRNRWQKPGDVTDVPRLSNEYDLDVNSTSSRFLTKSNYISLNNVRLGYTLPQSALNRIGGVQQLSVFVSGDNLWLKSARKGFNPITSENGNSDTYTYSPLSTITFGIRARF